MNNFSSRTIFDPEIAASYPQLRFNQARSEAVLDEVARVAAAMREEASEEMQVRLIEVWLDASRSCPVCEGLRWQGACRCCSGSGVVWE